MVLASALMFSAVKSPKDPRHEARIEPDKGTNEFQFEV